MPHHFSLELSQITLLLQYLNITNLPLELQEFRSALEQATFPSGSLDSLNSPSSELPTAGGGSTDKGETEDTRPTKRVRLAAPDDPSDGEPGGEGGPNVQPSDKCPRGSKKYKKKKKPALRESWDAHRIIVALGQGITEEQQQQWTAAVGPSSVFGAGIAVDAPWQLEREDTEALQSLQSQVQRCKVLSRAGIAYEFTAAIAFIKLVLAWQR